MSLAYKLTSSIIYPYVVIRNKHGKVIGPRKHMHWKHDIKDMAPTSRDIMNKLQYKSIAAAVIVSDCNAKNNRSEIIKSLKEELLLYGEKLDIYGGCSFANLKCPRAQGERDGVINGCSSEIESNYYFYLAFESSHCEDYVSEKLLHALIHFAVPVVYGGANYTRFMPDGMYLNARTLGVKKLAEEMSSIISNPQRYIDFFKWHGYYTFYDSHRLDSNDTYFICNVCTKLNKRIQEI
ncbi:alpha-(1,3)-fucosyltransferase C-like [Hyposmocoma kahamanoa]|uniref:alpha-(1,3)-fucosyltransferase C-like n=1 Tax=Hyposmocoma kahamanoa TaxID=1477025 RepID=UPI000E6D9E01|nr:alpha-(1,3)-fucosyltransferase C-like [Hyposmocoma kahamanoa]